MSCGNTHTKKENAILECVIDNYLKVNKVQNTDILDINEQQGWTENTSIIVITTLPKKNANDFNMLSSIYKGIELRRTKGTLNKKTDIVNEENWISNNLTWKKITKNITIKSSVNSVPSLNHPDQIQLIYNPELKCIKDVILGKNEIISQIMLNCNSCE